MTDLVADQMLVEWGGHHLDCCTTQSWMRQAVDHLVLLQADLSCWFQCGPRHYNKPFILFRPPHLENFTLDMVEAVLKISIALNCQYSSAASVRAATQSCSVACWFKKNSLCKLVNNQSIWNLSMASVHNAWVFSSLGASCNIVWHSVD